MENLELNLPPEWFHDPQSKCYTNMGTGDTFCYSEEMFSFVDPPPNPILLKDVDHTNMEMRDNSSETEEPFDSVDKETPATETAPKKAEVPVPKGRKITQCGLCGEEGHSRRSCSRAVCNLVCFQFPS